MSDPGHIPGQTNEEFADPQEDVTPAPEPEAKAPEPEDKETPEPEEEQE